MDEQALMIGLITMLILASAVTVNSFIEFMSVDIASAVLILSAIVGFIAVGFSLSDGVNTPMEIGLMAGVGLSMGLIYNLGILGTSDLFSGVFLVLSMVFSIGAVYMLIQEIRS